MPFEFDLIIRVIVFLINFFGFWLIFWVYFQSQNNKIKKWFSFLVFSSIIWTNFAYLARVAGPQRLDWSLIFTKITWSAVPLFFISFYFFISYLLRFKKSTKKTILDLFVLITGIICWFSVVFTNFIVERIIFDNESYYYYILGKGMNLFLLAVLFYMILSLALLFKSYFRISQERKIQIQYLLLGTFILYVMNSIFNIFLPVFRGKTQYYQFGDYSNFIFLSFIAYAIVKRKLFGMKIVLTTILIGLITVFLIMDILFFSEETLMMLWKSLILAIFLYFGYLLVKSVIREIRQREEIEKLSKAKSEFISIASHQLRTPLTAIKGYVSMVLEGGYGKMPPKMRKPMENVYEADERLIRLVNDLLNLSRIEAGKIGFEPEEVDVEELISTTLDILDIEAENKKIYLKFKKPKGVIPKIWADSGKLKEVVTNLIDNCIKYTDKGGVTVKLQKARNNMRIIIEDTGAGMTKTEIAKLFHSFSRGTAGTRSHTQGTGLGLYVSRRFIEMHNGKVWVESDGEGKGSTFYIELPIKQK